MTRIAMAQAIVHGISAIRDNLIAVCVGVLVHVAMRVGPRL